MEFWAVSTRLFTNPIFMLNLFSAVFIVMANTGFYTFLPKYFEFAFRQKASTAAAAAGAASCLASTTGLISAGYVIKRWQPSARSLSAWMIATTVMGVIGSLSLLVIGCPSLDIHGMSSEFDDTVDRTRSGRQIESAKPGALMYLPIGPGQSIRCPTSADSAAVSIAQMTFLATSMNIFSVVANISNNINNNNNNNNQVSYNAQSNNNVVTNTNVNNGNQVNVMVPILMP